MHQSSSLRSFKKNLDGCLVIKNTVDDAPLAEGSLCTIADEPLEGVTTWGNSEFFNVWTKKAFDVKMVLMEVEELLAS